MIYSRTFLFLVSGLVASSVAIQIGIQNAGYKLCINAGSQKLCSTDTSYSDVPNGSKFALIYKGDNCAQLEETCVRPIQFSKGLPKAWYRSDGCFYAEEGDLQPILCIALDECPRKEKMQNPYFKPEYLQPGAYQPKMGSNISPKCPQGTPRWNTAPSYGGKEPVSRWNKQSALPTTEEEEAQNTLPSDTQQFVATAETQEEEGDPSFSDESLNDILGINKRSEPRLWKRFRA